MKNERKYSEYSFDRIDDDEMLRERERFYQSIKT